MRAGPVGGVAVVVVVKWGGGGGMHVVECRQQSPACRCDKARCPCTRLRKHTGAGADL